MIHGTIDGAIHGTTGGAILGTTVGEVRGMHGVIRGITAAIGDVGMIRGITGDIGAGTIHGTTEDTGADIHGILTMRVGMEVSVRIGDIIRDTDMVRESAAADTSQRTHGMVLEMRHRVRGV